MVKLGHEVVLPLVRIAIFHADDHARIGSYRPQIFEGRNLAPSALSQFIVGQQGAPQAIPYGVQGLQSAMINHPRSAQRPANLDLAPHDLTAQFVPWIIGQKNSRELLLMGSDQVDAHRAELIGLVNRVVAADSLLQEARAVAEEIALNDPVAVRLTKKSINRSVEIAGLRQALDEALEVDIEIEATESAESVAFNRILEAEGLKAALRWRAAQLPKN